MQFEEAVKREHLENLKIGHRSLNVLWEFYTSTIMPKKTGMKHRGRQNTGELLTHDAHVHVINSFTSKNNAFKEGPWENDNENNGNWSLGGIIIFLFIWFCICLTLYHNYILFLM